MQHYSETASRSVNAARACIALALLLFSSHALNTTLFPPVAGIFPAAREISTYGGVIFSVVVAIAAWRKPSLMSENAWSGAAFTLSIASSALLSWGTVCGNMAAIIAASPLSGIASIWVTVLLGATLANLDAKEALLAISGAFLCEYAVQSGFLATGLELSVPIASVAYIATIVASYALTRPIAKQALRAIHDSVAPTVLNVTSPRSYIPLSSFIYLAILLFSLACGFAVSGETQPMQPAATLASFVPVTVVFACIAARGAITSDSLYKTAALLVFAGFLTAPLALFDDALGQQANAALLNAGTDVFTLLLYYLVAAVGARNKLGAVSIAASAFAAQWVGIGVGAPIAQAVGRMGAENPAAAAWATMAIAFAFVAFNFIGLGKFSFSKVIQAIEPAHVEEADLAKEHAEPAQAQQTEAVDHVQAPSNEPSEPDTTFAQACAASAARFGLTARETEVFELLARGRTSPFIQEKLVLSRNTVKTHVRHIYAKLNIHSQQELISIVEKALD